MIQIKATNFMGESLVLSPEKYPIKKVSGLSPMGGTISTQKMARHGTEYINSTTDQRNIVIDLRVLGDVETNRDALYRVFPTSMPVTLELKTWKKTVTIVGYVETCEVDFFEMTAVGQISIICPDPFFKGSVATHEVGTAPVTVSSSCPHETGYRVAVTFREQVTIFALTNQTTGEQLIIRLRFNAGDVMEIDTEERTVYVNGINAYNSKAGSWALLQLGENKLTANYPATITFTDRFIGL